MEGKSLQTLRSVLAFVFSSLLFSASAFGQSWQSLAGSFLEPNRFATIKDLTNRSLWLDIGFGRDVVHTFTLDVGLEALVWSRLQMLSQFRFPVETADYMFGVYTTFGNEREWRFRLSHISSHKVDGIGDTILGGPSSKYSRESVTLERRAKGELLGLDLRGSLGLKYLFHQVTKIESSVQFPATVDLRLLSFNAGANDVFISASSAQGSVWPSWGTQLVLRMTGGSASSDLYLAYYSGASKAGIDKGLHRTTYEVGIRLLPSSPW